MPDQHDGAVEDALTPWLQQLGRHAGSDTLLQFAPTPTNSIDLTHAHPSGLTQLLTTRRTRLSTLLREPGQYAAAMKTARSLRAKIIELGTERGIDVGYLAAGTASWRFAGSGRSESLTAPVMLAPVALTVRPTQDDYELQLTERARLNPALVRHLQTEQGLAIDAAAVARLAYGTARFDPHPVLEQLRLLTADVRGMNIEHHLLVSTFADQSELAGSVGARTDHPVLNALIAADLDPDGAGPVPVPCVELPPLDERAPQDEFLVLDADTSQQDVLDLVQAGHSLVVSAPPGTGQTQTAINAAAGLARQGRTVLVVAERRATLNQFVQQLAALKLGSLALQLNANITSQQLRDQLIRAISRNEKAAKPELGKLHATLTDHRHKLLDHVKSLHNVRRRWNCSPYQAMQSLAALTALDPAPATTVRLKRSVLDSITDRAELATRLKRAAELGSFSKASTASPWFGSKLLNRKETEDAHQLAVDLERDLPKLRERMATVAEHSQIALGTTFAQWGEQLELLVAVRESLDKFTPDIFDRPVTDLISATAPSAWRRERGIEMSSITRSRLRRVAKEYIRPGVHIADLHESLAQVQVQRAQWADYATTQRHPAVPTGLADLSSFHRNVQRKLRKLSGVLPAQPAGQSLPELGYDVLLERMKTLVKDKQTLVALPERTLLLEQMREHGLGELLDDLAAREVGPDQVGAELELAWWQSTLEAMISGDDYLAMTDGANLRKIEAVYRLADNAHIAAGADRLRWTLAENWRSSIRKHPAAAEGLKALLKSGEPTLKSLAEQSGVLVPALMPVWAASPLVLSSVLPEARTFDAVIILDAESTSLQSALSAVVRAEQVVAFGDGRLGGPRPFEVNVDLSGALPAAPEEPGEPLVSAFDALSRVLPVKSLGTAYRAVDLELTKYLGAEFYDGTLARLPSAAAITGSEALTVEYIADGTGLPGNGHEAVESVPAEIGRVVDLVFRHARLRPERSLAVITANGRHAAKVADAIRKQLAAAPDAAAFFGSGPEPFQVVPVERAAGLVRDDVVFSLGYGRTPHGRAVHDFGPLSGPNGRAHFLTAMTRARRTLQVLTCFQPGDLDASRLGSGAVDFYRLIKQGLGDASGFANRPSPGFDDALVSDLVERVRARGARVRDHYEGDIDIVAAPLVPDDEPVLPVALNSDGTQQFLQLSVRERSRLRPQFLERLGWRPLTLWTIEVFTDPDKCADLIGGYLGLKEPAQPEKPSKTEDSRERTGRQDSLTRRADRPAVATAPTGATGPSAAPSADAPSAAVQAEDTSAASQAGSASAPNASAGQDKGRRAKQAPYAGSAIPSVAAEDDPQSWGDSRENRDAWLKEQRPPHWG
ncbi:DUF4011 domain-containing protein [Arthrobacter sp. I2-34]|uniref:DUF4011 domain-containing protein n=1 Tax=Arthrobacter hankyongi TaxID=2904801 RepID=A0ABS9L4X3_9MICC|nr:DUF4011 domain-containing protein [Arthrobacter hankyongi]MCG2621736.1 DUF4011 domain-containing protein [Arthrobacter hankyongi]